MRSLSIGFNLPANALIVMKEAFVRPVAKFMTQSLRHTNWTEFNQTSGLSSSESFIGFGAGNPKAAEQFCIYHPAGSASGVAREAAIRVGGACLEILRFALTGAGNSEAFGNGELNWANASRCRLMTGAFTKTGSGGGTIVGRLVSITIGSGHLCADVMRIIDLSTRASRKKLWAEEAFGKYQSEMNSIPRSRLPTKKK